MALVPVLPPALVEPLPADALTDLASRGARRLGRARTDVTTAPGGRWHVRLRVTRHYDVWLIGWGVDSHVELHDHGDSAGAIAVVRGRLVEHTPRPAGGYREHVLAEDDVRSFDAGRVHDVLNRGPGPALSAHVYSPPLTSMTFFDDHRVPVRTEAVDLPGWSRNAERVTVDDELARARSGLARLTPQDAVAALETGALLVDIRPVHQRAADGEVPGALVIDRNVLEWRLDLDSPDRVAEVTGPDQTVIVFCDEGYASSLAAASLQAVGLPHATDLDGGYQAWRAAGLPTTSFSER